ncbi:uncharacterized protein LOC125861701 [Solanum stenotomum]|uniref:uncharacterized protein LOC125861701 n=1 Tax=Solanum stenotomum TaxID=172797 RepID=UPI0020D02B90|nr:uncharacterized protein LOC125861701 [Solanum stenotomum]
MEALLVLPRLQKNGFAGDPLIGTTTWTEFEAKSWNADVISCRIEDDEEFYPPRESLDGRESLIGTGSASRMAFTSIEVKSFGGSSSSSSYSSSSSASGSPVRSLSLSISLLILCRYWSSTGNLIHHLLLVHHLQRDTQAEVLILVGIINIGWLNFGDVDL